VHIGWRHSQAGEPQAAWRGTPRPPGAV